MNRRQHRGEDIVAVLVDRDGIAGSGRLASRAMKGAHECRDIARERRHGVESVLSSRHHVHGGCHIDDDDGHGAEQCSDAVHDEGHDVRIPECGFRPDITGSPRVCHPDAASGLVRLRLFRYAVPNCTLEERPAIRLSPVPCAPAPAFHFPESAFPCVQIRYAHGGCWPSCLVRAGEVGCTTRSR